MPWLGSLCVKLRMEFDPLLLIIEKRFKLDRLVAQRAREFKIHITPNAGDIVKK